MSSSYFYSVMKRCQGLLYEVICYSQAVTVDEHTGFIVMALRTSCFITQNESLIKAQSFFFEVFVFCKLDL